MPAAVAVDVVDGSARFDREVVLLDSVAIRTTGIAPVPSQRGSGLPEAQNEVVQSVFIQVSYYGAGLLKGFARTGRSPLPSPDAPYECTVR